MMFLLNKHINFKNVACKKFVKIPCINFISKLCLFTCTNWAFLVMELFLVRLILRSGTYLFFLFLFLECLYVCARACACMLKCLMLCTGDTEQPWWMHVIPLRDTNSKLTTADKARSQLSERQTVREKEWGKKLWKHGMLKGAWKMCWVSTFCVCVTLSGPCRGKAPSVCFTLFSLPK